ncbi:MAG: YceI family protein [Pseudomonadota bacterium]
MLRKFMIAAALTAALGQAATAAPRTYDIDPEHATIAFLVQHIGFAKVLGQFLKTSGSFVFDEETRELGTVAVTIDAASVFTNDTRRDKHVVSKDFLDAKANPEISFSATGGTITSDRTGQVTGDLTIRGETRPVTLDVVWNKSGPYPFGHQKHTIGISARATILRSEWGMDYAQGGIVGDEVELLIEIEAIARDE